jgi:hypothetical protein
VNAAWVLITPQTPGITITANVIPTVLPNGGTGNYSISISGAAPGAENCFTITLQDERHRECCSETICIENPCNCLLVPEETIVCKEDGTYSYSFTVTNYASFTMEHMYLFVDSPVGATITPNYIDLPTLLPGQTSGLLNVIISGAGAGEQLCYTLSVHDRRLDECCYFSRCITLPDCCKEDTIPPIIDCPDNATVDCGSDYTFIPGIGDNCDPTFAGQVKVDGKIDTTQPGLQCVTVTAFDDAGNIATRVCCVTVLDNCNGGPWACPRPVTAPTWTAMKKSAFPRCSAWSSSSTWASFTVIPPRKTAMPRAPARKKASPTAATISMATGALTSPSCCGWSSSTTREPTPPAKSARTDTAPCRSNSSGLIGHSPESCPPQVMPAGDFSLPP